MGNNSENASYEKRQVALISVFAAFFLTGSKIVIGVLTGSLGILSEALHSGLDLVAALITFFSVKASDKPADNEHQYGHGKIESLSALAETVLLFVTCSWIIYEVIHRLVTGKLHIEVTYWSYVVVAVSIIVDYSRSRKLTAAAKKYNSQALEADALHFSTDIWSSLVVLLGLICFQLGLDFADAIAALIVSFIVLFVSYRLGKRSIGVLLDQSPQDHLKTVENVVKEVPEVITFHDLKIRSAGADIFVELTIHLNSALSIEQCHKIAHDVEDRIHAKIDRCSVHIHQEPDE